MSSTVAREKCIGMQPLRLPSFRHVMLLLGSSSWWGSLHASAGQAVSTTAPMLIGDAKRPQSMSFTGAPTASVFVTTAVRSGCRPVRLNYAAATTYATASAESPGIVQRGPQVQQRLGLITALTNRQSVPGIAPQIVQRDMGGRALVPTGRSTPDRSASDRAAGLTRWGESARRGRPCGILAPEELLDAGATKDVGWALRAAVDPALQLRDGEAVRGGRLAHLNLQARPGPNPSIQPSFFSRASPKPAAS